MKRLGTPGLLKKQSQAFVYVYVCVCARVCTHACVWNKLKKKQTKISVSEIAGVTYSPEDSMTGHQAKGLSELHNWSPRDTTPQRGQSKSQGLLAVLCFGLWGLSDLCCASFFICSKKLAGNFYFFFCFPFLGAAAFFTGNDKITALGQICKFTKEEMPDLTC